MSITIDFNLNDEVFVLYKELITTKTKCHLCEGNKKLVLIKFPFDCPACQGNGEISNYHFKWNLCKEKINQIGILTENGIQKIKLYLKEYIEQDEKDCFHDERKARTECLKRNIQLKQREKRIEKENNMEAENKMNHLNLVVVQSSQNPYAYSLRARREDGRLSGTYLKEQVKEKFNINDEVILIKTEEYNKLLEENNKLKEDLKLTEYRLDKLGE